MVAALPVAVLTLDVRELRRVVLAHVAGECAEADRVAGQAAGVRALADALEYGESIGVARGCPCGIGTAVAGLTDLGADEPAGGNNAGRAGRLGRVAATTDGQRNECDERSDGHYQDNSVHVYSPVVG